jgi:hypothetical protein
MAELQICMHQRAENIALASALAIFPLRAGLLSGNTLWGHKVTDVIAGGEFVAWSHRAPIPDGIDAVRMHTIT